MIILISIDCINYFKYEILQKVYKIYLTIFFINSFIFILCLLIKLRKEFVEKDVQLTILSTINILAKYIEKKIFIIKFKMGTPPFSLF